MPQMNFMRAETLDQALELLERHGHQAAPIAGGTDLMVELRQRGLPVDQIIDLNPIEELKGISQAEGRIRVGAGVTHAQAERNALLLEKAPLLAQACSKVGSPQIRNRGTVGGNIMTAAACADTVPALIALDAVCSLQSKDAERRVPLAELVQGAGLTGRRPNELLTWVEFPIPHPEARQGFTKLIRREAFAKSRLSLAALARQDGQGKVLELSLVVGAAAPAPLICGRAAELLLGDRPTPELIGLAAESVSGQMVELTGMRWSTEYKKPVLEDLARRLLHQVLEV